MRARRALLYMPGDDLHKIQKATTLGVDSICMDMEDGVAPDRKEAARQTILEALRSLDFGRSERLVRINDIGSGLEDDDLQAVLPLHPDGIVIPKVEDAGEIQKVGRQIDQVQEKIGSLSVEAPCLIAIVESGRGLINLPAIAAAHPRLQALIFGAEDYTSDVGALRTPEGWEVFYARSAVVAHTAAFNLQAIDMVFVDFRNREGLVAEARQGAQLGFSGKQIIHPNQVEPVQEAFTPSEEAIAHAKRVVTAYENHRSAGLGAFALDGKMVDAPVVKAAERVLARARAAGKL